VQPQLQEEQPPEPGPELQPWEPEAPTLALQESRASPPPEHTTPSRPGVHDTPPVCWQPSSRFHPYIVR